MIRIVLILAKNFNDYLHATIKTRIAYRLNTGPRRIYRIKNINKLKRIEISHGTIEIDSYADAALCRSKFTVLNYTSQECDVVQYDSKDVEKNLPIATCTAS